MHKGQSWGWHLSARRKRAIWKKRVPEETKDNSDEVTWGLAEADWQMMDEVVAHWRPKMDALMARVLKKDRAARRRGPVELREARSVTAGESLSPAGLWKSRLIAY